MQVRQSSVYSGPSFDMTTVTDIYIAILRNLLDSLKISLAVYDNKPGMDAVHIANMYRDWIAALRWAIERIESLEAQVQHFREGAEVE